MSAGAQDGGLGHILQAQSTAIPPVASFCGAGRLGAKALSVVTCRPGGDRGAQLQAGVHFMGLLLQLSVVLGPAQSLLCQRPFYVCACLLPTGSLAMVAFLPPPAMQQCCKSAPPPSFDNVCCTSKLTAPSVLQAWWPRIYYCATQPTRGQVGLWCAWPGAGSGKCSKRHAYARSALAAVGQC